MTKVQFRRGGEVVIRFSFVVVFFWVESIPGGPHAIVFVDDVHLYNHFSGDCALTLNVKGSGERAGMQDEVGEREGQSRDEAADD